MFSYGQVEFERTYYKKVSGGYEYLADTAVGINERDRISEICYAALLQAQKICLMQRQAGILRGQNKPTDCNELCERK